MSYEENKDLTKIGSFEKTLRRVLSFKAISTKPAENEQTSHAANNHPLNNNPNSRSPRLQPASTATSSFEHEKSSTFHRRESAAPPVISKDTTAEKMTDAKSLNGQEGNNGGSRSRAHTTMGVVGSTPEKDSAEYRGMDRTASFLLRTYYSGKNEESPPGSADSPPATAEPASGGGSSKFESLQDMLQKKLQEDTPKGDEDNETEEDKTKTKKKKGSAGRKKGMKLANTRNLSPTVREDVPILEPPPVKPPLGGSEGYAPPASPRNSMNGSGGGSGVTAPGTDHSRSRSWSSTNNLGDSASERGEKEILLTYRALYSFKGQRTGDLTFEKGDIIRVLKKNSNWWDGECNGRTGIFPSNYVEGPLPLSGAEPASSWNQADESLEEEEAAGDIMFDEVEEDVGIPTGRMVKILSSGPTEKLIAVMAGRTIPEDHYIEAFLLTRRYFISSRRLYESLVKIFNKVPDGKAPAEELEEHKKWQKTIQGRVLNVFQKWAENNFHDFYEEPQLFESVVRFVAEVCHTNPYSAKLIKALRKKKQQTRLTFPEPTEQELEKLMDLITRGVRGDDGGGTGAASATTPRAQEGGSTSTASGNGGSPSTSSDETKLASAPTTIIRTETSMTNAPAPVRGPKEKIFSFPSRRGEKKHQRVRSITEKEPVQKLSFIDINPKDLAQQLTIIEQSLFLAISPLELLFGSWKKKEKNLLAPHVVELIDWFNKINSWVASEVVLQVDVKKRRAYLSRFIQIAEECRKLGNYNAVKEIVSALNRSCINRLTWTWKGLTKQDLDSFEKLTHLMDHANNSKEYRIEFKAKSVDPPCLPYIGVHLQDLLAMEELPTRLKGTNHVNFKKMRGIERAVRPIMACQQQPYDLQSRQAVQRFLTVEILALSEAELFDASRSCEPQLKAAGKG